MALSTDGRDSDSSRAELFQTTHWSVVLRAGRNGSPQSAEALEELCRAYWYPLYGYIRRRGHDVPEAQDLTQEFFARIISKNWLSRAEPRRGRFRSFLLGSLNHFLANEWNRSQRQKRGGGKQIISLDDTAEGRYQLEPATETNPEKSYERQWALTLFERALQELRAEFTRDGKARIYEVLHNHLWQRGSGAEYQRVAEALGLSVSAVSSLVHRMRRRYQDLVRHEVAQTVSDPSEVEAELRSLMSIVSSR